MTNLDDLMKQAADLLKQGSELQLGNPKSKDLGNLNLDYQSWYTRALAIVKLLTPERTLDFQEAYKVEKRKEVNYASYAISDYLMNLVVKRNGVLFLTQSKHILQDFFGNWAYLRLLSRPHHRLYIIYEPLFAQNLWIVI